jgi:hypothetical protein
MWVASSALSSFSIFLSCGGNSLSPNRDADCPLCDSSRVVGVSASRTCGGSSSQTASHVAVSLAPCLISMLGPHEFLLVTLPGTAKASRFCSRAQREVMRVPLYSAASMISTPTEIPLMMRLRSYKRRNHVKVGRHTSLVRWNIRLRVRSVSGWDRIRQSAA